MEDFMAIRNTDVDIRAIISTDLTDEQITPFIITANALVDEILLSEGFGDTLLKQIECWLAAHFVAIRDPRAERQKVGDVDVKYYGKSGLGLDATPYGQQVKVLDYSGKMSSLGGDGRGAAEVRALL
jgi:hypothetical protein